MVEIPVRALAFYLPQFHPTPENDQWWGTGFTEWANVVRAKPLFEGHRQPRLPTELGFYDLRVPEIRHQQATLAKDHGLHGFCYYFYWFHGRRILERPIDDMIADSTYDFPFCFFWANEGWTRTWTGKGEDVLIEQRYSEADAHALADYLVGIFGDNRYITIDGKPVFVVYHPVQIKLWPTYAAILRQRAKEAGFPDIYLCMVRKTVRQADHRDFGCDAAIEFPPSMTPDIAINRDRAKAKFGTSMQPGFDGDLRLYGHLMRNMSRADYPGQTVHKTVMIDFDTTARVGQRATVFPDASPELYARWLAFAGAETLARHSGDARLMFIFAWNEWAEGAYLEPDDDRGRTLLELTRKALQKLGT